VSSRRRAVLGRANDLGWQLAVLGAFFVVWEIVTLLAANPYFPRPSMIFARLWSTWFVSEDGLEFAYSAETILPSVAVSIGGWLVAAVLSIAVGIGIGLSVRASWMLLPVINFMRSIPPPALLPIMILLLGFGADMRFALVALGCAWPILLNTIDGVRNIDRALLETATAYHIPKSRRFFRIVLPAASPYIFSGMRISISISLILIVIAESISGSEGLGAHILTAQRRFQILDMWAGIAMLGIVGYLYSLLLIIVENRALAWHRGARGKSA